MENYEIFSMVIILLCRKYRVNSMRRVLVVDDEENIRVVLRTLLKKHNYQVARA